ncbi:MAG TPA: hypothetical protein VEF76_05690 [Patescibacteria group bacterium]|nr:hypothetical protein [Patescibacteria group bacterium]
MNFEQTSLPDRQLFREAFAAGWSRYLGRFAAPDLAAEQYIRGPVAMARLIYEHGGEEREVAAAACLAGPAVFSEEPEWLGQDLSNFAREFREIGEMEPRDLYGRMDNFSADARLLLQASAIMLIEQLVTAPENCAQETMRIYTDSLQLYSAARGQDDSFKLDTRFEIAAMKVTSAEGHTNIWSKHRDIQPRVHA